MTERLNRFLARSGIASRREADRLIAGGFVKVNARMAPAAGRLIDPELDRVEIEGRPVERISERRWLAFHKPAGVVVTARDPQGRTTVLDLLPPEHQSRRLFPVGRLDAETTGLLLVTDDGELANRVQHPKHKVAKEYLATVRGVPGESDLRQLRQGIELSDGVTQPAEVQLLTSRGQYSQLRVTLREGRNRQVRRMFAAVGHPVEGLTREAFGPIRLGRLHPGGWRRLRPPELKALREAAGLAVD
ncbi:MAG: rRNA pseudouridine synthase [Candidatus Dormibacteraeota bacterium]|uniref:Pseudouridine synthase n=1 Tax=Candidatus Dormiibacter inghamiae TaxID=3127013 RepID=A0A934NHI8_9BACT|nr:rRNA pseudouridine synthase [Candidatus Dormibacteraeota bacterium]MBJ7607471.1 rRNA pseudouridine synthase [Candidatus Dormibacteraeota bacterium]